MIRLGELLNEILDERLGVPEGILEIAEDTYNTIIKALENDPRVLASSVADVKDIELEFEGEYKISDYSFGKVKILIENTPDIPSEATERVDWRGMAFGFEAKLAKDYKKLTVTSDLLEVKLNISFVSVPDTTWQDILDFFQGPKKEELMSSIAHEFKHAYDATKSSRSAKSAIQYRELSPGIGLPALDKFLYGIYYTSLIENLVRPTEVATLLKFKKVDKKDFVKALQETEVYKNLKRAENVGYDEMIQEMISEPRYLEVITNWFRSSTPINPDTLTDEEKIKKFLDSWFSSKKSMMKDQYKSMVYNKPIIFFQLFDIPKNDLDEEKEKAIKEFNQEIDAFKNAERFFRYQEKKVKTEVSKILRKLAKLYDYL